MPAPNFFIIGNPKCGTTSLAAWLPRNPEVFMAEDKEPHFFATDMEDRAYRLREEYEALFEGVDAQAVGEASVWYAYSEDAISNILAETPEARFIFCLRNPVDMAWALHNQMIQVGNETEKDFDRAWSLISRRRAGQEVPSFCKDARKLDYESACRQGEILARVLEDVPAASLHLVFLEDMARDPASVVADIEDFLEVPRSDMDDFPVENGAFERRSDFLNRFVKTLGRLKGRLIKRRLNTGILTRLDLANRTASSRPKMSIETRKMLLATFEDDITLVETLSGRNLFHWRILPHE